MMLHGRPGRMKFETGCISLHLAHARENISGLGRLGEGPCGRRAWPPPGDVREAPPAPSETMASVDAEAAFGAELAAMGGPVSGPPGSLAAALSGIAAGLHEELRTFLRTFGARLEASEKALAASCDRAAAATDVGLGDLGRRVDARLHEEARGNAQEREAALDVVRAHVQELRAQNAELSKRLESVVAGEDWGRQLREASSTIGQRVAARIDTMERRAEEQRITEVSRQKAWRDSILQRCEATESRMTKHHSSSDSVVEQVKKMLPDVRRVQEMVDGLQTESASAEAWQRRLLACESAVQRVAGVESRLNVMEGQFETKFDEQAAVMREGVHSAGLVAAKIAKMEAVVQGNDQQMRGVEARVQALVDQQQRRAQTALDAARESLQQRLNDSDARQQQRLEVVKQAAGQQVADIQHRFQRDVRALTLDVERATSEAKAAAAYAKTLEQVFGSVDRAGSRAQAHGDFVAHTDNVGASSRRASPTRAASPSREVSPPRGSEWGRASPVREASPFPGGSLARGPGWGRASPVFDSSPILGGSSRREPDWGRARLPVPTSLPRFARDEGTHAVVASRPQAAHGESSGAGSCAQPKPISNIHGERPISVGPASSPPIVHPTREAAAVCTSQPSRSSATQDDFARARHESTSCSQNALSHSARVAGEVGEEVPESSLSEAQPGKATTVPSTVHVPTMQYERHVPEAIESLEMAIPRAEEDANLHGTDAVEDPNEASEALGSLLNEDRDENRHAQEWAELAMCTGSQMELAASQVFSDGESELEKSPARVSGNWGLGLGIQECVDEGRGDDGLEASIDAETHSRADSETGASYSGALRPPSSLDLSAAQQPQDNHKRGDSKDSAFGDVGYWQDLGGERARDKVGEGQEQARSFAEGSEISPGGHSSKAVPIKAGIAGSFQLSSSAIVPQTAAAVSPAVSAALRQGKQDVGANPQSSADPIRASARISAVGSEKAIFSQQGAKASQGAASAGHAGLTGSAQEDASMSMSDGQAADVARLFGRRSTAVPAESSPDSGAQLAGHREGAHAQETGASDEDDVEALMGKSMQSSHRIATGGEKVSSAGTQRHTSSLGAQHFQRGDHMAAGDGNEKNDDDEDDDDVEALMAKSMQSTRRGGDALGGGAVHGTGGRIGLPCPDSHEFVAHTHDTGVSDEDDVEALMAKSMQTNQLAGGAIGGPEVSGDGQPSYLAGSDPQPFERQDHPTHAQDTTISDEDDFETLQAKSIQRRQQGGSTAGGAARRSGVVPQDASVSMSDSAAASVARLFGHRSGDDRAESSFGSVAHPSGHKVGASDEEDVEAPMASSMQSSQRPGARVGIGGSTSTSGLGRTDAGLLAAQHLGLDESDGSGAEVAFSRLSAGAVPSTQAFEGQGPGKRADNVVAGDTDDDEDDIEALEARNVQRQHAGRASGGAAGAAGRSSGNVSGSALRLGVRSSGHASDPSPPAPAPMSAARADDDAGTEDSDDIEEVLARHRAAAGIGATAVSASAQATEVPVPPRPAEEEKPHNEDSGSEDSGSLADILAGALAGGDFSSGSDVGDVGGAGSPAVEAEVPAVPARPEEAAATPNDDEDDEDDIEALMARSLQAPPAASRSLLSSGSSFAASKDSPGKTSLRLSGAGSQTRNSRLNALLGFGDGDSEDGEDYS